MNVIAISLPEDMTPERIQAAVSDAKATAPEGTIVLLLPHGWTQAEIDQCAIDAAVKAERSCCLFDLGLRRIDLTVDARRALEDARTRILSRGKVEEKT